MSGLKTVKARRVPENPRAGFLPYQARWCADRSRIKLVEKSRQVGFSWATSNDLVAQAVRADAKYDFWVSSRDEMQARLFLQDCKAFADGYDKMIEATSMALLEGMSLGLPTIASDYGGNPFVITSGQNGLLFPSKDSAALADAMAELMDHPEEVAIMREKALETYQSRFTGEVFARNTEQIYENVLKGASK